MSTKYIFTAIVLSFFFLLGKTRAKREYGGTRIRRLKGKVPEVFFYQFENTNFQKDKVMTFIS